MAVCLRNFFIRTCSREGIFIVFIIVIITIISWSRSCIFLVGRINMAYLGFSSSRPT